MKGNFSIFVILLTFSFLQQLQAQSWTDFERKHVLNPGVDTTYASWGRVAWNTWLQARIPSDYGTKSVNSVIVKIPNSLLSDFSKSNPTHTAGPDFHWSRVKLPTYVMQLVTASRTYDAYRCPDWFVLARLETSDRPMHYHGYANTQLGSGSLPLNLNQCTKIN